MTVSTALTSVAAMAPKADAIDAIRKRCMYNMINSERFSDVTFLIENRQVFGHRAILATFSDYLDKQFCGPYLDSRGTVQIEGIRYSPFVNVVLPYLYTGELNVPEDSDLISVLEHADRWQLEDLTRFVAAHICESNHLDGHVCIQALNFAKHHCSFDGLALDKDSPELWSGMYQECLKYFERHGTELVKCDPSILTHIESDDLMYVVLSNINIDAMPSRTLLEMGRVFLLWLKADAAEDASPSETLFEVLAHMKTMSAIDQGSRASALLKIPVRDINSDSWSSAHETLKVPGFSTTIHVQKSKPAKHLGVFFTQSTECEFMNRWPLRTRLSVHLEPTGRRTSKAAKDFTCEFTRQWRDQEQGQGFPDFASLSDLKPDGKYVHEGCIHLHANLIFEPHPVFRLCMLFASCGFQQIRENPKLSMVDSSLLKEVLNCDRLDAKNEQEVLEVVAEHVNHYPHLVPSMLECVRFAYVPITGLVQALKRSSALRASDHLKKSMMASLRSTEDGIVCGRRSYIEEDVQLTLDALVDAVLYGSPISCFSGAVDSKETEKETALPSIADVCPCKCAQHTHSRPLTTQLEQFEDDTEEACEF